MKNALTKKQDQTVTPYSSVEEALAWCDDVARRADEIVTSDFNDGIRHLHAAEHLQLLQKQTRMDDLKKAVSSAILELKRSIGRALLDMTKNKGRNDSENLSYANLGISKAEAHRYQTMAKAPDYVWNRAMHKIKFPTQKAVFEEIKRHDAIREVLTEVEGSTERLQEYFTGGRDPKLLKEELTGANKGDIDLSDYDSWLSDDDDVDYDYVGSAEKKEDTPQNDVDLRDGDGVTVDLTRLISRVEELVPVAADIHDEVMNAVDGDRIVPDEQKARMVKVTKQVADPMSLIEDQMQNM